MKKRGWPTRRTERPDGAGDGTAMLGSLPLDNTTARDSQVLVIPILVQRWILHDLKHVNSDQACEPITGSISMIRSVLRSDKRLKGARN